MNKSFLQFFQDGTNSFSATRLGFLVWVLGVLGVWIFRSVTGATPSMATIDTSVITLIGILMAGKAVQSFSANEAPSVKAEASEKSAEKSQP